MAVVTRVKVLGTYNRGSYWWSITGSYRAALRRSWDIGQDKDRKSEGVTHWYPPFLLAPLRQTHSCGVN